MLNYFHYFSLLEMEQVEQDPDFITLSRQFKATAMELISVLEQVIFLLDFSAVQLWKCMQFLFLVCVLTVSLKIFLLVTRLILVRSFK